MIIRKGISFFITLLNYVFAEKHILKKVLLSMAAVIWISGCTITGPAEDQWDLEEKEDRVELNVLSPTDNNSEIKKSTKKPQSTDLKTDNIDDEYAEFQLYQEWRRERDANSQAYQEFKEFKKYIQWKKERAE